jgi:predicted phosphodiesterase
MDYKKYKISGKNPQHIVLFGDLHYGSKEADIDLIDNTIKKIKRSKDTHVILTGDLIENASKFSVGSGVYDQVKNPNDQTWEIAKKLKPIASKILCGFRGNHCFRSMRDLGFDIGESIANYVGYDYIPYMGIIDLDMGKIKYRSFGWHGAGFSQSTPGRIKLLERQAETFTADFYFCGHTHDLADVQIPKRDIINGQFRDMFKHFILCGSALKYDNSYAEMYGYKMMKRGWPEVTLNNKQKEISVDLNYAEGGI